MSADPRRAELDARVLAWMQEADPKPDDERFTRLALDVFTFQFEHCEPYRRLCQSRGRTPQTVSSWQEIPPVPTGAFKELALRSFAADRCCKTFRTSGTSTDRRGELHLDTLVLYEASLRWSFRRYFLPDLDRRGERIRIRVLAPAPHEVPDSSLSHMFGCVVEELGAEGSGFDVQQDRLELVRLQRAVDDAIQQGVPLALCGTTFAFVHWLDELERTDEARTLPAGSRILETGGFKGRSRELSREELHAGLGFRLGVPADSIVNQYGMTELGSQFYDSVRIDPSGTCRKLGPPWARVRIVVPGTDREVERGALGAIHICDLANTGSVLAVQTADLGRRVEDGFEPLGREPGAEARGCSLAADEMLGAARSRLGVHPRGARGDA